MVTDPFSTPGLDKTACTRKEQVPPGAREELQVLELGVNWVEGVKTILVMVTLNGPVLVTVTA